MKWFALLGLVLFLGVAVAPTINAFSDNSYITMISTCEQNETVFIELVGIDGDPTKKDMALVSVNSNSTFPDGFPVKLRETGPNSGIFQGNVGFFDDITTR